MIRRTCALLILCSIAVPQLGLPLAAVGINQTNQGFLSFALAGIAALLAVMHPEWRRPYRAGVGVALAASVILVGFLIGTQTLPLVQVLQGARILLLPVLAAIVGCFLKFEDMRLVIRLLSIVVFSSFVASLVERALGVEVLVDSGLRYGTTVRTFGGELRAPGLALTNYDFGAFAGVFAAIAWLWWIAAERSQPWRVWAFVSAIAGTLSLLTSSYRTGMVVLALAVLLSALLRSRRGVAFRLVGLTIVAAATWAVAALGLLSTDSLNARQSNWEDLLTAGVDLFGGGLGSAGAASGSSFSAGRVSTDNYFLSLILQFGFGGFVILLCLFVWTLRLLLRSRGSSRLAGGFVMAACIFGFWFVEFWEYSSAMMLAILVSTQGYSEEMSERVEGSESKNSSATRKQGRSTKEDRIGTRRSV